MARVIYSDPVSKFTGSVGGITFQNNVSGSIVRLKSQQTLNPSNLQAKWQNGFADIVNQWSHLDLTQKGLWNRLASNPHYNPWGTATTLSGYQWFLSCNLNRRATGNVNIIQYAPDYVLPDPPSPFIFNTADNHFILHFYPSFSVARDYLLIYCSPPTRSLTEKSKKNLIICMIVTDNEVEDVDLTSIFLDIFNIDIVSFLASALASMVFSCCIINSQSGLQSSFSRMIYQNFPS